MSSNHNLYFCINEGHHMIIMIYVDDLLLIGNDITMLQFLEKSLERGFEISRLDLLFLYIGIEFVYLP